MTKRLSDLDRMIRAAQKAGAREVVMPDGTRIILTGEKESVAASSRQEEGVHPKQWPTA